MSKRWGLVLALFVAGASACGGSSGGGANAGSKSFSESSAIAAALGCGDSYVSEQRFNGYNSGHCTFHGHHTYLVACAKQSDCQQIANNIDALATVDDGSKWLLGPDWIINVQAQDLQPAQSLIGGEPFTTTAPT